MRANWFKAASVLSGFIFVVGCTGNKSEIAAPSAKSPALKGSSANVSHCSQEDLAAFDRNEGTLVDLDREDLPKGLFLASVSEMLIEKRGDSGQMIQTRLVLSEQAGDADPQVVCAENPEKLGIDFQTAISAVVKFDTRGFTQGTGLTTRQFFVHTDRSGYGAIFSTPRNQSTTNIKQALSNSNALFQVFKTGENELMIKYMRERDGIRTRLLTRLQIVE
jgi:hypothetical protein